MDEVERLERLLKLKLWLEQIEKKADQIEASLVACRERIEHIEARRMRRQQRRGKR
jgi:predicted ATP-grasp superfamily ATP-dependent carboligase